MTYGGEVQTHCDCYGPLASHNLCIHQFIGSSSELPLYFWQIHFFPRVPVLTLVQRVSCLCIGSVVNFQGWILPWGAQERFSFLPRRPHLFRCMQTCETCIVVCYMIAEVILQCGIVYWCWPFFLPFYRWCISERSQQGKILLINPYSNFFSWKNVLLLYNKHCNKHYILGRS